MNSVTFRTLRAEEIEVRPSHIQDGKVNLLLYINSRAVVDLLNETVGNMNWQSRFYEANGQTIGEIGIYDEERGIWVWKSDTGTESKVEADKGLISDTYKRVMSRWGIQELYTSPKINIPDDGYKCSGYKVSEIQYNDQRKITHLVITDRFGKEKFRWDKDEIVPTASNNISSLPKQNSNNSADIIQSIKDSANIEYYKEGTNRNELRRFVDFYVKKVERDGWKGNRFDFDKLFASWMSRSKAS